MAKPDGTQTKLGLRERKKIKTRAAIQKQAMRLFRKHGYEATTVEQIADAAEISPSTFFRYFRAKEDVVSYDALDPVIIESFIAQPAAIPPIQAIRQAIKSIFGDMSPDELLELEEREKLMRIVPELRAKAIDELVRSLEMFSKVVAKRMGRSPEDTSVRTLVGAVVGVIMTVWLALPRKNASDLFQELDAALENLETGFKT